jgi:hypothetical protein
MNNAQAARIAELEAALKRMVDFAIPANCAKGKAVTAGWDLNVAIARAALAATPETNGRLLADERSTQR